MADERPSAPRCAQAALRFAPAEVLTRSEAVGGSKKRQTRERISALSVIWEPIDATGKVGWWDENDDGRERASELSVGGK